MTKKLILDVDTGTDDAVAIMLAAQSPELELVAVTTVNGNVPLDNTTRNSLDVLHHIGRDDIDVHPGLASPIARPGFPGDKGIERDSAIDMHGSKLPVMHTDRPPSRIGAIEYLVETFRQTTNEITLVPVGPLSNIAAAVKIEPRLVEAVPEVVIMGGGHFMGNTTPSAEFNIWADPEAAAIVFAAGFRRIVLVPLDATHQAIVSADECVALAASGSAAGTASAAMIQRRIRAYSHGHRSFVANSAPVHDALCIAYLIDPAVITTRPTHVDIETRGELTIGRTVMDTRPHANLPINADVAFDADREIFVRILQERLTR